MTLVRVFFPRRFLRSALCVSHILAIRVLLSFGGASPIRRDVAMAGVCQLSWLTLQYICEG